jgi:hypothetical protein
MCGMEGTLRRQAPPSCPCCRGRRFPNGPRLGPSLHQPDLEILEMEMHPMLPVIPSTRQINGQERPGQHTTESSPLPRCRKPTMAWLNRRGGPGFPIEEKKKTGVCSELKEDPCPELLCAPCHPSLSGPQWAYPPRSICSGGLVDAVALGVRVKSQGKRTADCALRVCRAYTAACESSRKMGDPVSRRPAIPSPSRPRWPCHKWFASATAAAQVASCGNSHRFTVARRTCSAVPSLVSLPSYTPPGMT